MNMDQPSKVTLGVVAICRNEERDLPGFLDHLISWVDEIILVDDGSTDRTMEMARNAGPKVNFLVSPRQPGEYYSLQRNKGIKAATSDWLLHMDIDERVTPQLRDEILRVICLPDKDAYKYTRLNFFLHRPVRGGMWAFFRSLRLGRRDKFHFEGKIHEKSIVDAPKSRIGSLKGPMWHFNEPTYELRLRKAVFYGLVDAESYLEKQKRITVWDLIFQPLVVFIKTYILLFGFRDGTIGFILALRTTAGSFDRYAMAWDIQNRIPREKLEAEFAKLK
jgi:glycosyltransferase involved in cell wall biosynthesis